MKLEEIGNLIDLMSNHLSKSAHLTILIDANCDVLSLIKEVRALGFFCMIRTTAFGEELVITDKVDHGDVGPPQSETS